MGPIDTDRSGRAFFLVCGLSMLLLCVGCTSFVSYPQSFKEAVLAALSTHLQVFQSDAPVVITEIVLLAEYLRETQEGAFSEFCDKHGFIPEHMTAEEYAKRLYRSAKRLILETDSMEMIFSDAQAEIARIRAEIPLHSVSTGEDSASGQPVFSGDVRISFEHVSRTCPEPCVPTLARVRVTVRVVDTASDDSSSFVNLVFFEKKQETWAIVSFEKDLLDILEGRYD